jgi:hypothetical protein
MLRPSALLDQPDPVQLTRRNVARAFSLLLGFPKQLCSGVFFAENAHKGCGVGLHPQGKCSRNADCEKSMTYSRKQALTRSSLLVYISLSLSLAGRYAFDPGYLRHTLMSAGAVVLIAAMMFLFIDMRKGNGANGGQRSC